MPKRVLPFVPPSLAVENVEQTMVGNVIRCRPRTGAANCPCCGQASTRLHSYYERRMADLPWQGDRVRIHLRVRRLRCDNSLCTQRIFAEAVSDVVEPYGRRLRQQSEILRWVGLGLGYLKPGDTLVVWKLDRLGRSLPNLLTIIIDLKERGIAFRSLTEQMDTSTPHGELLFSLFGALAQYERALTRERVMAGLAAARRRGRRGGRPPTINAEMIEQITAALDAGVSKASVCRSFKVPRSTLIGTLARIGWTAPAPA